MQLYWSASSTLRNPEYFPQSQRNLIREDLKEMNQLRILMCHLVNVLEKIEYARMEILVFMHNLVKRFKCQTVIPNGNITYNPTPIPAKGLPVRLIPQRSWRNCIWIVEPMLTLMQKQYGIIVVDPFPFWCFSCFICNNLYRTCLIMGWWWFV